MASCCGGTRALAIWLFRADILLMVKASSQQIRSHPVAGVIFVAIGFVGLVLPFVPNFTHQGIPVLAGVGIAAAVFVGLSLAMKKWPATNWKPPRTAVQVVVALALVILGRVLVHSTSLRWTSVWGSIAAGIMWALGLRLMRSRPTPPDQALP